MHSRYLVISDVDGTLLGDQDGLNELRQETRYWGDQLCWVVSSGRFFDSVRQSVIEGRIPNPSAIIGGVGTEISHFPGGQPFTQWREHIVPFQAKFCAITIREIMQEIEGLEFQPWEFQSDLKVSYYLHNASPEELARLERRLTLQDLDVQLVYSSRRDLDILPARANKGQAARFLAELWSFPAEQVIVAGDSANDLSMFQVGFRGIVVGNAAPELRALSSEFIYQADRPYGGGVLEGLKHWLESKEPLSRRSTLDDATYSI